jgi:polyferredoxin
LLRKPVKWDRIRRIAQVIFLLGWLVLWVGTAGLALDVRLLHLPAKIDPLLALAQSVASRTLTVEMLLSLIVIIVTVLFGRVWCGWICPVGTTLDLFSFKRAKKNKPVMPETWRMGKYLLLFATLIAALFGNLSLLVLDPMTIWVRTLTGGIGPALNTAFTAAERGLAQIPWMSGPLTWIDQLLRPAVFPTNEVGIRFVWLPVVLFTVLILLNLVAERFWCRYLCPLGGMLGLISKFSVFKRRVNTECISCGKCDAVCPTSTIDAKRGYASDAKECTMCMDCLNVCTVAAIKFSPGPGDLEKMPYDPGRRQLLITGAVAIAGLAVIDSKMTTQNRGSYLLRPPGAIDDDLLEKCLRCGLCLRVCPTGALHASIAESGVVGVFTPVLVPRLGYCLYSCKKCGEVCPVAAIPPLALEDKQRWVIGSASIDEDRCIPWADGDSCIVCEEMCPVPEKAIVLEDRAIIREDGSEGILKLPHVVRERCIGCGICEYKCPRAGEAAIRVYRLD